jgi:hypothetical protein
MRSTLWCNMPSRVDKWPTESHVFSAAFVAMVRLGYNRAHTTSAGGVQAINPAAADPSLGWAPGLNVGTVHVTGLTNTGPGVDAVHADLRNRRPSLGPEQQRSL